MKRFYRIICLVALFAALTVSCRQLYTTSFGESFARDGLSISSSTSIGDLLDIANESYGTDPIIAKDILDVFAGKSQDAIKDLPIDDKTTILNLASAAAIDFGTIDDIFGSYDSANSDTDALVETALGAFNTSVDLTAIETLLGDTTTLSEAPVDSIIFASAVVLADIASEMGTTELMDILASGDTSTLVGEQKIRVDRILAVSTALSGRDTSDATIGGFDLTTLLEGTTP